MSKEEDNLSEMNNRWPQEKTIRFMNWLNNNRLFYVYEVRKWLRLLDKEKISFSRFVELFNEKLFEQQENASQHQPAGLHWVKASERLPEGLKDLAIKVNGICRSGYYYPEENIFVVVGLGCHNIDQVEWLCESESPSQSDAVEFAEWIIKSDVSQLPDETDYPMVWTVGRNDKTTAELYQLFLKSKS